MGDMNEGNSELALHPAQFLTHLNTKLLVQRGERLIKQQHAGFGDCRPRQRNTLLLAARQIGRQSVSQFGQAHLLHHLIRDLVPFGFRLAANAQREGDVVADGQMRKQRVGLKHHRGAPLDRRQSLDILAPDHDFASGRFLVARNHPQDRGLAATGGPEKAAIGGVRDLQIDAIDHIGRPIVALAETCQFDIAGALAHLYLSAPSRACRGPDGSAARARRATPARGAPRPPRSGGPIRTCCLRS